MRGRWAASFGTRVSLAVRGSTSPVLRRRWTSRRTQAGLTVNASATSAVGSPASMAARTRTRRSIEYGRMPLARVVVEPL
ncbi:hypothetical protein ETAA1_09170 [Urbifossiella limnaea]|uniref:Uncharacterized protein n=1 Tax=Urbifossiella limnaea TaxID=2528023 RepID=A0A517XNC9_9BACT|nr:hypothetical protein ETAA1_09170 [Urbifossiella limnaea]